MFEIVEELSLLDKLFGTFKYIIASWVTGAFLSIPIVSLIFRDSPEKEENSVSENKESVHDFLSLLSQVTQKISLNQWTYFSPLIHYDLMWGPNGISGRCIAMILDNFSPF